MEICVRFSRKPSGIPYKIFTSKQQSGATGSKQADHFARHRCSERGNPGHRTEIATLESEDFLEAGPAGVHFGACPEKWGCATHDVTPK